MSAETLEAVQEVEVLETAEQDFAKPNINSEDRTFIEGKISEIREFLKTNKDVISLDSTEKDKLYGEVTGLWNELATAIKKSRYAFPVDAEEYDFLFDLLNNKVEYNVDNIFVGLKVKDEMFPNKAKIGKGEKYVFHFNSDLISYVYHLIKDFKISGLTKKAFMFAQIISYIGEISKIFNAYDTTSKHLSSDINNWTAAITTDEELKTGAPVSEATVETEIEAAE